MPAVTSGVSNVGILWCRDGGMISKSFVQNVKTHSLRKLIRECVLPNARIAQEMANLTVVTMTFLIIREVNGVWTQLIFERKVGLEIPL